MLDRRKDNREKYLVDSSEGERGQIYFDRFSETVSLQLATSGRKHAAPHQLQRALAGPTAGRAFSRFSHWHTLVMP